MTNAVSLENVTDPAHGEEVRGLAGRAPWIELQSRAGDREWLTTNFHGAFAIGTVDRELRRKYHSILTVKGNGPTPSNLVADVVERLRVRDDTYALVALGRDSETSTKLAELHSFSLRDHPVWIYDMGGVRLRRELVLAQDSDSVALRYTLLGGEPVELVLEPQLLFRSLHGVAAKDLFLDGRVHEEAGRFWLAPYARQPRLYVDAGGEPLRFERRGTFRELVHEWEGERGYERGEFAFSPGLFVARLSADRPLTLRLGTEPNTDVAALSLREPQSGVRSGSFRALLERAAEAFVVTDPTSGLHAGLPWLGESLRETLLALPAFVPRHRGFVLDVLESIAPGLTSPGSSAALPVSPVHVDPADVPLLFIRAVEVVARAAHDARAAALVQTAAAMMRTWVSGEDAPVRVSQSGLLFVVPGYGALTWMNATVDGGPVTPRSGYAVELNALYLNALAFLAPFEPKTPADGEESWLSLLERATASFRDLFLSVRRGHLADVHDGVTADESLRPNQLWAVALPYSALTPAERLAVLDTVKAHLLTDVGIRTLSPEDPHYTPHYEGDVARRETAAHQGSAWPFLLGLYADALALLGEPERLREDLLPVLDRLERHARNEACLGQISELFDGEAPHHPRGAPAHVGSVTEVLRVARMVER